MYQSEMDAIDYLISVLDKIIDTNINNFKETGSFQVRLLFAANYDYENFLALSTKNKGYEFALSELSNLKSIDSDDEFMEFIDFIAEQ